MEDRGLECAGEAKVASFPCKTCGKTPGDRAANALHLDDLTRQALALQDTRGHLVLARWDALPAAVRDAVVLMVESAATEKFAVSLDGSDGETARAERFAE